MSAVGGRFFWVWKFNHNFEFSAERSVRLPVALEWLWDASESLQQSTTTGSFLWWHFSDSLARHTICIEIAVNRARWMWECLFFGISIWNSINFNGSTLRQFMLSSRRRESIRNECVLIWMFNNAILDYDCFAAEWEAHETENSKFCCCAFVLSRARAHKSSSTFLTLNNKFFNSNFA